jgi:flagellar hook-associated protein 1 FlgK
MSLVGSLMTAMSALQATQAALRIASNNIANVNTEGYTRKAVSPMTTVLDGEAAGVELSEIQRSVDENLLRQIRNHIASLAGRRIQNDFLTRTQQLFGTPADNSSLSHAITDLGSALEAMALSPESTIARASAVGTARRLSDQLNAVTRDLQQMRSEADQEIARTVERINALLVDIDDLNGKIAEGLASGDSVADLQDQRDLLIDRLAEETDIQYFERGDGRIVIATKSGRTLLHSLPIALTYTPAAQLAAGTTYQNGIGGIGYGPGGLDITQEVRSGRLAGLLAVRDHTLVDLQAEIDRLSEALQNRINALHNNGTAFPPPSSLTSSHSFSASDAPRMAGTFRVAVVDPDGLVVESLDIDLATLAPPDIGTLVAQIDSMANASASIDSAGQVVITTAGDNGIAVNELDSAASSGNSTVGLAHFLGLNDVFDSATDYDAYTGDRVTSDRAPLGLAGTLDFLIGGTSTSLAYAAGDSLSDIAAAITVALGGANITATVVNEAGGFRLEIRDGEGDNFFVADSGGLTAALNLRPAQAGTAGRIEVRGALLTDPGLMARGKLSNAALLPVGDVAISVGDGTIAQAMADAFTDSLSIAAAGRLPAAVTTLAGYATDILALNATTAEAIANDVAYGESFRFALETQSAAISDVNLDEELANLVVLQNAYGASARLTTTISEMMDLLLEIVR